MRLECEKYRYPDSTSQFDKNIFSNITPELIERMDLGRRLVRNSMSDVEYPFEDSSGNTLFTEASNFSFSCKNIISVLRGTSLQDFFETYTLSNLYIWKFFLWGDDEELIYSGLIYKNGVKFDKRKTDILNITVVGYEKEFRIYYENIPLNDYRDFNSGTGHYSNPIQLQNFLLFNARLFFPQLFPTVQFDYSPSSSWISDWYVASVGYTYSPSGKFLPEVGYAPRNMMHIKAGYNNFYDTGVTKFAFFEGVMQSMGWIWFFYLGRMYIKRRGDVSLAIKNINHKEKAITHSVENIISNQQSDIIVINDGQYFDDHSNGLVEGGISIFRDTNHQLFFLGGDSSVFYSEKFPYSNIRRPFLDMDLGNFSYINRYVPNRFVRGYSLDDRIWRFNSLLVSIASGGYYHIEETLINYPIPKTLKISPIINSVASASGIDKNNPRENSGVYYGNGNMYRHENQTSRSQIFYTGNPGNCMIKFDVITGKYLNYDAYITTNEFKRNFKPLLRAESQLVFNYEVNELITNPFQTIMISEYLFYNISSLQFNIQKLSFNPGTKKTKMILQNG